MKATTNLQNLFALNLAMLIISTSGVLGRLVQMPPPLTIWWRCLIALFALGVYARWKNLSLRINFSKDGGLLLLSGILMAGHWVFYFYALQYSNVAIAMLSLFTYPVITVILEPLFLRSNFQWTHLGMGILVLAGIYFLTPEFSWENNYSKAIGFGSLSAICYSFRNLLMKLKVKNYSGSLLMFYQLMVVLVFLSPAFIFLDGTAIRYDWPVVLTLGVLTTAIGHTLFVNSFQHFSLSTASIISSSQPIYGTLLGILFLAEFPAVNTLIGGALILSTVVWESMRSHK